MAPTTHTALPVVASTTEREGHATFGVVFDGAFVPIAQHKLGHVAQAVEAFVGRELPVALTAADLGLEAMEEKVKELQAYIARVEQSQADLRTELAPPAKADSKPAAKPASSK